mmetsp:Transcript_18195/g.43970  ORF Transcript_18195/g.43970 Transcript_18195/m.43970 type:complete len:174 (+) Transcript_18195:180-701(+)
MIQQQASTQNATAATAHNVTMTMTNDEILEKKQNSNNKKQKRYETQDVVPDLIEKLSNARIEVLQNSNGPPLVYERDPHLRLRRTLTVRPPTFPTGIQKYSEAQYVISTGTASASSSSTTTIPPNGGGTGTGTTTGKRINLSFSAPVQTINGTTTTTTTATATKKHGRYSTNV